MMGFASAYKRWRHTRGYGVHSPYAYRVLTEVITMPYAYYGYHTLDRMLKPKHRHSLVAKRAKLALRLSVFLKPKSICVMDPQARLLRQALSEGCTPLSIYGHKVPEKAALVASTDGEKDAAALIERVSNGGSVLAFNVSEETSRKIAEAMPEGVGFIATDALLLIPRPETAKAIYTANF